MNQSTAYMPENSIVNVYMKHTKTEEPSDNKTNYQSPRCVVGN